jgi:hypothetical protein
MTTTVSPPMPFTSPFRSRLKPGSRGLLPAASLSPSLGRRDPVQASETPLRTRSARRQIKPFASRPASKPISATQPSFDPMVKSP